MVSLKNFIVTNFIYLESQTCKNQRLHQEILTQLMSDISAKAQEADFNIFQIMFESIDVARNLY